MIVSLYIREVFLLTCLPQKKNYVVGFHVELNFSNEQWLLISRTTLIPGDFNFGIQEQHMKSFCENYNFYKITNKLRKSR